MASIWYSTGAYTGWSISAVGSDGILYSHGSTVPAGITLTITATAPSSGWSNGVYTFKSWKFVSSGASSNTVHYPSNPFSWTTSDSVNYSIDLECNIVKTYVEVSSSSNGSISSNKTYANTNETITITGTPSSGYGLKSVSATAGTVGAVSANKCTIQLPQLQPVAKITVSGTFEKMLTAQLTTTTGGSITVNSSSVSSVTNFVGDSTKFTAVANQYYSFSNWEINDSVGGTTSSSSNPLTYTFRGTVNPTIKAVFTRNRYSVYYGVSPSIDATVTATGISSGKADAGSTLTFTQKLNDSSLHYQFKEWQYTNNGVTGASTNSTLNIVMPEASLTVTAVYKPQYKITLLSSVYGGSSALSMTPASGWQIEGGDVTLTAGSLSGYSFNYWSLSWGDDASTTSQSASCSFKMRATTLYAKAYYTKSAQTVYNVTKVSDPGDGGTIGGPTTFTANNSLQFTATPNSRYTFIGWTYQWSGEFPVNSNNSVLRFLSVKEKNLTVTAKFENKYTISVTKTGTGAEYAEDPTITINGTEKTETYTGLDGNESVTLSAGSSGDGQFEYWLIDNMTVYTNPYTFTMNAKDYNITASYSRAHKLSFASGSAITFGTVGDTGLLPVSFVGAVTDQFGCKINYYLRKKTPTNTDGQITLATNQTAGTSISVTESIQLTEDEVTNGVYIYVYAICDHSGSNVNYSAEVSKKARYGSSDSSIHGNGYGIYYWNGTEWIGVLLA